MVSHDEVGSQTPYSSFSTSCQLDNRALALSNLLMYISDRILSALPAPLPSPSLLDCAARNVLSCPIPRARSRRSRRPPQSPLTPPQMITILTSLSFAAPTIVGNFSFALSGTEADKSSIWQNAGAACLRPGIDLVVFGLSYKVKII